MPRFHRNRNSASGDASFPAQDEDNSIPFYNARLFAMHESLIQSYTHFTYHANYMYNILGQTLNGTRNSINSNPYPWLIIPNPQPMQPQTPQTHQTPQTPQTPQTRQTPQTPQTRQTPQTPQTPQTRQTPQTSQTPQRETPQTSQTPQREQGATTRLENNIINALFGIMSQPLPSEPRLTQIQLNDRVEHTEFGNIVNPINTICSITHDVFEPNQRVSRIRQCGHIFNSTSLSRWLRVNNTCPTCRYNLLSGSTRPSTTTTTSSTIPSIIPSTTTTTSSTTTTTSTTPSTNVVQEPRASSSFRRIEIPIETEININAFYNELLRNSTNIPGFELNAVDDNSVVFSFDLIDQTNNANHEHMDEVD